GAEAQHDSLNAVLGCRPSLRKDARFYILFGDEHKYTDGTRSGEAAFRCSELRYLDPSKPLDGGMDFGNMNSLVTGQEHPGLIRILKSFYTLSPETIRDLADDFLDFYAQHPVKVLRLWYDRAGNAYQKQGEDKARQIKEAIEKDATGKRTGWSVELMSRKQSIILMQDEYDFMHAMMKGDNPRLPRLLIDAANCSELVSSLEGARAGIKYKGDTKVIYKIKKGEKLALKKLPRLSTNLSDAFKYFCMRSEWRKAVKAPAPTPAVDSSMVDDWFKQRKNR
ncbi:MAG: hypothetical protein K2G23_07580, partial [Muribaculaceae bacterium]|nr:hypothetical protein [Muribaculaceae bacterium]